MSVLKKCSDLPVSLDDLSKDVVDCIFKVHKTIGPGYLEKIYEDCLFIECQDRGFDVARQVPVKMQYNGRDVASDFRLDLVVENRILLELKAVAQWHPVYDSQLYSYLKSSGLPLGFLVNFNVPLIKDGIKRFVPKPS